MEIKLLKDVNIHALPKHIKSYFSKVNYNFIHAGNFVYIKEAIDEYLDASAQNGVYTYSQDNFSRSKDILVRHTLDELYLSGFQNGYTAVDKQLSDIQHEKNDKSFLRKIFSKVYKLEKKYSKLPFKVLNDHHILLKEDVIQYAHDVGEYIRCWDFILTNPDAFEVLFDVNEEILTHISPLKFT